MKNMIPDIPLPNAEKVTLFAVLAIIAMVSAYFSFQGALLVLQEVGEGLFIRIGAGVYAIGSWAVLYILWKQTFLTVPMVERGQAAGAILSLIKTCGCAVGLSGAVNVAFIAGGEAMRVHMTTVTEDAASASNAHHKAIQRVGDLAHDIGGRGEEFQKMAADDRATGRYSGFRGGGAFTDAAETIGGALANLEAHIADTVAASAAVNVRARGHLEAMRRAALRQDAPPKARMAAIGNEITALRSVLAEVSADGLSDTVGRELERMTRLAEGMSPTSKRAAVREGQARAIALCNNACATPPSPLAR